MRKIKSLGYLFIVSLLLVSSCAKEDDENTDARDKFIGSWLCKETHKPNSNDPSTATVSFTISIAKGSGSSITISKFNNLGASTQVEAIVSGNALTINAQKVDGYDISGTGSYSNDRIEMDYTVDQDSYTSECTKK